MCVQENMWSRGCVSFGENGLENVYERKWCRELMFMKESGFDDASMRESGLDDVCLFEKTVQKMCVYEGKVVQMTCVYERKWPSECVSMKESGLKDVCI